MVLKHIDQFGEIKHLRRALEDASRLRTFPNDAKVEPFQSVAINQLGKLLEQLSLILREICEGKTPREKIQTIQDTRIKLEELSSSRGRY